MRRRSLADQYLIRKSPNHDRYAVELDFAVFHQLTIYLADAMVAVQIMNERLKVNARLD